MKTQMVRLTLIVLCNLASQLSTARAQSSVLTYQGQLTAKGTPAHGFYDLRFAIFGNETNGMIIAGPITNVATWVSNGQFTVTLDFGMGAFTGADRWLEIGIATNHGRAFNTLSPRQPVTSTPYAITAARVSGPVQAGQLAGSLPQAIIRDGFINSAMLGTGSVTREDLADGAVDLSKLATETMLLSQTSVANPTPADGDYFGGAVAGVGNQSFLIGAWQDDTQERDSGAAYLFNLQGELLRTFTNPLPRGSDYFGKSVSSLDADTVLIGAPYAESSEGIPGAVFVFDLQGNLLHTIVRPSPAVGESFGHSVSGLGPDKVIIGAPEEDAGALDGGAAYLFSRSGTWLATFENPTPQNGDLFGFSVSAVGDDQIVISSVGENQNTGAAYLFGLDGQLLMTFLNPSPAKEDSFGRSVAGVGPDKVVIGADGDDMEQTVANAGAAYLFDLHGTLLTTFTNPTPEVDDFFGFSVAGVGADRVLVGALGDDTVERNAGAAYLFDLQGNLLATFTTSPFGARDQFSGSAVSGLGNDTVLVGAPNHYDGRSRAGAAYLYITGRILQGLTSVVGDNTVFSSSIQAGAVVTEKLADGAVTTEKLADQAVTGVKLARYAVSNIHLYPFSITADKMADNVGVWAQSGSTIYQPSGGVGIRTNNAGGAALNVNGEIRATDLKVSGVIRHTGLLRSGLETLTSEPPNPAGLVIRPINSTISSFGQVVARTDTLELMRDGTAGGFMLRAPSHNGDLFAVCMGVDYGGHPSNVNVFIPNVVPGDIRIYLSSDDITHFQCSFGDKRPGHHHTQVTLSRPHPADANWVGTLISTFNQ